MFEYVIVSGKNLFGEFTGTIRPAIYEIQRLFVKIGLSLSVNEAFLAIVLLIGVVGLLLTLLVKKI